jgi:arabinofuranosyltransferase
MGEPAETASFSVPTRWRKASVFAVSVAAIALYSRWRFHFFADDALISLREASFLAHGRGLTFNPGERIEAATNLLWVLLLTIPGAFGLDLVAAARVLGELSAGCTLAILAISLWGRARFGVVASLWVWLLVQPSWACWAGGGLEGPLVALLGMIFVVSSDSPRLGGAALALGFVARPDALVAGSGLPIERRQALVPVFMVLVVVVAVTLFRRAWFGAWIPNSAAAKVGFSVAVLERGLRYCAAFSSDGETRLVLVLAAVGAWSRRDELMVRRAVAWVLGQLAFTLAVGGDGLAQFRFAVPVLPALALLAGLGLETLCSRLSRTVGNVALVGCLLVWAVSGVLLLGSRATSHETQRDNEVPRWTAAGRWLAANTPTDMWVAVGPIGAVGFYSERPILDILGLADRHIAHTSAALGAGLAGHERHDGKYVLDRAPGIILLGNVDVTWKPQMAGAISWEQDISADPRLLSNYIPCSARLESNEFLNFWYRRELGACPGDSQRFSEARHFAPNRSGATDR